MEKRNKNRVDKRLFVKFGKEKPERVGFTVDVSPTGLFIKTTTVFQPGTTLRIELTLPDQRTLLITGQVMWAKQVPSSFLRLTKKSGMGVRLTPVSDDYKQFVVGMGGGIKGTGP